MKSARYLIVFALSTLLLQATASAETQLGVVLGSNTGISAKFDAESDRAFDAGLSYSINSRYGLNVYADYLINKAKVFSVGKASPLTLYYGVGVRVISIRSGDYTDRSRVGIRAPIGVYYQINDPSLEFFGEIAPVLDLTPATDVSFDVGIGVRFRF